MTWEIYKGNGVRHEYVAPEAPPWRQFPLSRSGRLERQTFVATEELIRAVNAAIYLRRPLLVTGPPGSGKSSIAESVADELMLGGVLRWHVTSHSTLEDAIYRYDALGRLQDNQLRGGESDDITKFLRLGPLGTALLSKGAPRVLLIDEFDKGELDLPSDLLNVLERGEYEISELNRLGEKAFPIRAFDSDDSHDISGGRIRCTVFPITIITSNGERPFPGPFLRRCVRIDLRLPDEDRLTKIVAAHFNDPNLGEHERDLIRTFAEQITSASDRHARLAVDQLLNSVFLTTLPNAPTGEERDKLIELIQRELYSA